MKNSITIFLVALLVVAKKTDAQPFLYKVTPPSCATCCDGAFTMTVNFCTSFAFQSTPTLNTQSWYQNVLSFKNVCSGTYQIHIYGSPSCGEKYDYFTMPVNTDIISESADLKRNFVFYDSPTQNVLTTVEGAKIIVVTDSYGKTILNLKTDTKAIYISAFPSNIYLVALYDQDNRFFYRTKIIKD